MTRGRWRTAADTIRPLSAALGFTVETQEDGDDKDQLLTDSLH